MNDDDYERPLHPPIPPLTPSEEWFKEHYGLGAEPDWFDRHYGLVLLAVVVGAILFTIVMQSTLGGFWSWQTGKP